MNTLLTLLKTAGAFLWHWYTPTFLVMFVLTWIAYLAVMNLKVHQDESLPWKVRAVAYVVLGLGLVADFVLNMLATLRFFDLPREMLLTYRLNRYKQRGAQFLSRFKFVVDWRFRSATLLCSDWLDRFAPNGVHCVTAK